MRRRSSAQRAGRGPGLVPGSDLLAEVTIRVPSGSTRQGVVGSGERNLKLIREALGVSVTAREDFVRVTGESEAVRVARNVLERLGRTPALSRQEVLQVIADEGGRVSTGRVTHFEPRDDGPRGRRSDGLSRRGDRYGEVFVRPDFDDRRIDLTPWDGELAVYAGGRAVQPKTPNQQAYLEAIRDNDMVFAAGPAGTGKTYLAVAAAVHLLRTDRVKRLILTRPAVEAGERLGFLPGDMQAKVNPYLRPLLDAVHDMMDYGTIRRFMDSDVVEIVPLAFMRGRTLNNAMVILDEAQNTTRTQMQMFLTRLGHGSKMVVTGDITQVDLPEPAESGLVDAIRRLRRVKGVGMVAFEGQDVVRHTLVQRVIEAYGIDEAGERGGDNASLIRGGRGTPPAGGSGGGTEPARVEDVDGAIAEQRPAASADTPRAEGA